MSRTEYRVVVRSSPLELNKDVNYFLKEGWVCQGGISLSLDSYGSFIYAQAIVKNYEK
jgi:hypothetical protein